MYSSSWSKCFSATIFISILCIICPGALVHHSSINVSKWKKMADRTYYISSQTISIPRSPDGDNKTWFHFISSSKNLWSITISSFVAKAHKAAWSQRPLNQVCHQILDNCRRQTGEYRIFKRSFVKRNCYIAKYLQKYLSKCFVLI